AIGRGRAPAGAAHAGRRPGRDSLTPARNVLGEPIIAVPIPHADDSVRRAELAASLDRLRQRIAAACTAAGRDPAEVTLVAVTKTYPASDVAHLAALGLRDIGENRDQEAAPKAAALTAAGIDVRWHYVGQLQRNKARSVASYASAVHSVDRVRLVDALGSARAAAGKPALEVFIQLSIDGDTTRGGAVADDVPTIAAAIGEEPALTLAGLMAGRAVGPGTGGGIRHAGQRWGSTSRVVPRGDGAVRGHERRSRSGYRARRDTRADR